MRSSLSESTNYVNLTYGWSSKRGMSQNYRKCKCRGNEDCVEEEHGRSHGAVPIRFRIGNKNKRDWSNQVKRNDAEWLPIAT